MIQGAPLSAGVQAAIDRLRTAAELHQRMAAEGGDCAGW